ncbi:putative glycosyl hydrolase-like protein [Emericellopsis cladophorae]|uniref:Glycosyl hydrolase-like protein n=1 Tax=Emericellopsis cladophorae TaxID=2686198 RepID=A0A9Q0BCP2_9HYPO|nr:putative glycosyl hydrolase-like protein [Emericellopsis cladophorae]KAI6779976.1 putative glycosyl hydrolase-like protein [Emericellopsis cladophorae]
MNAFRLFIEDGQFRDPHGRQVVLRGINVAGDAKLPSDPDQPSQNPDAFFDGDNVNFHARPFTQQDAHVHFARVKRYGFNTIRYVFTWEAIEAAGPGKYDEEYIQHTIEILRIAKRYGFFVFMDPHQDVWSRFTGGSGAPMWTVYACGLNPQSFAATEAAIVHNTYPDPAKFPKMIWSTNYYRLAAATIFTFFFAGRDFAPKCIIDGVNIQDYLQDHFVKACGHLAQRINEAGDLENEVVMGWESMNEPNRGLTGYVDLSQIPKEQNLKKGTCPTIWQTILNGSGRACEIDEYEMGGLGPYKTGSRLVDPHGEIAWLPVEYDDTKYGWKRDPGWKFGECIWAQHGVWDPTTDTLLKKDYFKKNPRTGKEIDYPEFTNTYFMDFWRRFKDSCRSAHKDCIMLMQYPTLEIPPNIKGTPDDDPRLVFTPHYYDGITLMTKHWNSTWNVDVVGVLRGKYWHPAFAIKVGETAIRNCLRDQLKFLSDEGKEQTGNHPCILSEFGIPYDMDDKKAYQTGDYSSQSAALDANYFAVEGAKLEGHCLWLYTVNNDHQWGDQWNGEDLSINSVDDRLPPSSAVPRNQSIDASKPTDSANDVAEDDNVTPANLQRTLTSPSISSVPSGKDPQLTNAPGLRAAEAFIRPTPTFVAGTAVEYGFDLRNCTFTLQVSSQSAAGDANPTIIYLPEFHFPRDISDVDASGGKWEMSSDEDEGTSLQRLKWWNPQGKHELRITGLARKHNVPPGTEEEEGYLEQCREGYSSSCSVM